MLFFYLWSFWSPGGGFLYSCSLQFVARFPLCLPFYMCFLLLMFPSQIISSLLQHPVYLSHLPPYHLSTHSSIKNLLSSVSSLTESSSSFSFPTSRIYSFASIPNLSLVINIYIMKICYDTLSNLSCYFFFFFFSLLLLPFPLPEVLVYVSSHYHLIKSWLQLKDSFISAL